MAKGSIREAIGIMAIALLLIAAGTASGWLIEPENIIYGQIYEGDVLITQADTSYTVTLEVAGEEVARYTMGQVPIDYYVLNVPIVSTNTYSEPKPSGYCLEGEEGVMKLNGQLLDPPITIILGTRGAIHYHDIGGWPPDTCIILRQGLNIIGYPRTPPSGYSAFDFLEEVGEGQINSISRLNQALMRTENADWVEGEVAGEDFPIKPGEGYIVYMKQEKEQCLSGGPPGKVTLSLKQGMNIVSIPGTASGYSAFNFLDKVGEGQINSISRLNQALMRTENADWVEGEIAGEDFPIKPGEGYIVYMKQDMEVTY